MGDFTLRVRESDSRWETFDSGADVVRAIVARTQRTRPTAIAPEYASNLRPRLTVGDWKYINDSGLTDRIGRNVRRRAPGAGSAGRDRRHATLSRPKIYMFVGAENEGRLKTNILLV